jgi:uncharacterized protein with GYD domain
MAKFLIEASYTQPGVKGLIKDGGTGRKAAVEKAISGIGGTLEVFYFAFGDTDLYIVADIPDNVSAAALSLITNSPGTANVKIRPLLTPDEVDRAVAIHPEYQAPGA